MAAAAGANDQTRSTGDMVDDEGVIDAIGVPAEFCRGDAEREEEGHVDVDEFYDRE